MISKRKILFELYKNNESSAITIGALTDSFVVVCLTFICYMVLNIAPNTNLHEAIRFLALGSFFALLQCIVMMIVNLVKYFILSLLIRNTSLLFSWKSIAIIGILFLTAHLLIISFCIDKYTYFTLDVPIIYHIHTLFWFSICVGGLVGFLNFVVQITSLKNSYLKPLEFMKKNFNELKEQLHYF